MCSHLQKSLSQASGELAQIEHDIEKLPKGSAHIYSSGGRVRIKGTLDGKPHFYKKAELPLAKRLLWKEYLLARRKDLLAKCGHLKACVLYEGQAGNHVENFLLSNPGSAQLLSDYLREDDQPLRAWMEMPDSHLAPNQEQRTEPSAAGYAVRSKSEVMIVTSLLQRGLYFRYEEPLSLGGKVYYPDFTIKIPRSQRTYIFEHFGMMDDPSYSRRAYEKMAFYAKHGLLPSVNFITTFETKTNKLSIQKIDHALDAIESLR